MWPTPQALYLLLLRLLSRDYNAVGVLADSVATDTTFTAEELAVFNALGGANDDRHPDAHACRLRISLMTLDSHTKLPWNLTKEATGYVTKLSHVSANCRLSLKEELQLLESGKVVLDEWNPAWDPLLYTLYQVTLLRNRARTLAVWLKDIEEEEGEGATKERDGASGTTL